MLENAQLHEAELKHCILKSWYDARNIYWTGWIGDCLPSLPDNNYETHHFVSVNDSGKVLGYICYSVDYVAMSADRFGIISFEKNSVVFARDLYQAIYNIFKKYNMNRISWYAYADNPAVRGYRNFIKRHGGKECGYERSVVKLQDGKLHDRVTFEILADEFIP